MTVREAAAAAAALTGASSGRKSGWDLSGEGDTGVRPQEKHTRLSYLVDSDSGGDDRESGGGGGGDLQAEGGDGAPADGEEEKNTRGWQLQRKVVAGRGRGHETAPSPRVRSRQTNPGGLGAAEMGWWDRRKSEAPLRVTNERGSSRCSRKCFPCAAARGRCHKSSSDMSSTHCPSWAESCVNIASSPPYPALGVGIASKIRNFVRNPGFRRILHQAYIVLCDLVQFSF